MLTLEELVRSDESMIDKLINQMTELKINSILYGSTFSTIHFKKALLDLKTGNNAKNNFYISGFCDNLSLISENNRFLDYGLIKICSPILSDNEKLITSYSKLRYQKGKNAPLSMDEMVAVGEIPIWCNTVQFFMVNDIAGIERNLNIIETKTLKKLPKREEGLLDDYEFYKALHSGNKNRMEEILDKLVSPKIHKKRNDNEVLNQYISCPAAGYAKLAWRKGIEVEVNSPLVPKELLPIKPLEKYFIPYDFFKEYEI